MNKSLLLFLLFSLLSFLNGKVNADDDNDVDDLTFVMTTNDNSKEDYDAWLATIDNYLKRKMDAYHLPCVPLYPLSKEKYLVCVFLHKDLNDLHEIYQPHEELCGFSKRRIEVLCDDDEHIISLKAPASGSGGIIPPYLSELPFLHHLELQGNQLTGTIPTEFIKLHHLKSLQLQNNYLQGNIPSELFQLPFLLALNLQINLLDGSIPSQISRPLWMTSLSLSHNQLNGTIPTQVGLMPFLSSLDLSDNQLTGTVPTELARCSFLEMLSLSRNHLKGPLPKGLINNKNLLFVDFSDNESSRI